VAVLVKLEDGGSVLFRQLRVGRGCKSFYILKFRSMQVDAPVRAPDHREERCPGHRHRGAPAQHKIDELPQLWNVLVGEMSLVGPRPEVPRYVDLFRAEYTEILAVRPGITDLASIKFRNESALLNEADDPERVRAAHPAEKLRLSREYVRNASLTYDMQLVFTTLACLMYPRAVERVVDVMSPYRYWLGMLVQAAAVGAAYLTAFGSASMASCRRARSTPRAPAAGRAAGAHAVAQRISSCSTACGAIPAVRDLRNIVLSVTLGSITWWMVAQWAYGLTGFSRGVIAIEWLLSMTFLAGLRIGRRSASRAAPGRRPRTGACCSWGRGPHGARGARPARPAAHDCQIVGMLNGDIRRKGRASTASPCSAPSPISRT
jgi:lipopolysaccharide/colanic/teichoic acid biosynthesis glycosyltransferase